ncbi:HlyD family efflux transporter periplasmic adaptor subunit [Luteimonas terrae]|uniref:HlyD family efflux transporter periplasmic adaptor subunit n=1 Tax=Luteimonas terrae TaxID=1530191 RepID=A0A4R5UEV0_9GAMM|nr:HlyD family efflux transporter periplasmic adaptor subunit [Luteimonas terrae]KPN20968.1 secretion protein HlyD [Xanthomonas sp. Mitacek01]TDK33690.1 HlyD family efflux transporter periplasmic adaptor subunit [Luteimonas terrae]
MKSELGDSTGLARARAPLASRVVWATVACLLALLAWAAVFELDEVTTGTGRVVPTSREQIVQSLEGGILSRLHVREGDVVEAGQVLAHLDPTLAEATVEESASRMRAALAKSVRLQAEVGGGALEFPDEVQQDPDLVRTETALFQSRRDSLQETSAGLSRALALINQEIALTAPLVARGAASNVELLRLRRQANELQNQLTDLRTQYMVTAREELALANAQMLEAQSVTRGRSDALRRSTIVSPVKGIVKNVEVTTVGGVVPPNGKLLEIVPLDDKLLIEARVSPRDVAFLHPGQRAVVKITAYDYHIYGGLEGQVAVISPDTIQDEVKPEVYYYRVFIRTERDHLLNAAGRQFHIFPGMVATADIHTGSKTIMSYLMKPLNRAGEALRER